MNLANRIMKSDMNGQAIVLGHVWVSNGHWMLVHAGHRHFKSLDRLNAAFKTIEASKEMDDEKFVKAMNAKPDNECRMFSTTDILLRKPGKFSFTYRLYKAENARVVAVDEDYAKLLGYPDVLYQDKKKPLGALRNAEQTLCVMPCTFGLPGWLGSCKMVNGEKENYLFDLNGLRNLKEEAK